MAARRKRGTSGPNQAGDSRRRECGLTTDVATCLKRRDLRQNRRGAFCTARQGLLKLWTHIDSRVLIGAVRIKTACYAFF